MDMERLSEKYFAQFPLTFFPEFTPEDAEKAGGCFDTLDASSRIVHFDTLEKAKSFCESFGLRIWDALEKESESGRFCVNDKYVDDRGDIVAVVWNLNWADDYFLN